jgi:hypothetical protein
MDLILERGLPSRPPSDGTSGAAPVQVAGKASVPQANSLEGPCSYLVKPAAQEEK